jgi:hypothetical protein
MKDKTSRSLSCFFAREFFWPYIEKKLDKIRISQLEVHLKDCHDCTSLLERERVSQKLLLELAHTKPTEEVISFLKKEHHFWSEFVEKAGLSRSLETLKWAGQLSFVAILLMMTIHFLPWLNLARSLKNLRPAIPQSPEIIAKLPPTPTSSPAPVSGVAATLTTETPTQPAEKVAAKNKKKPEEETDTTVQTEENDENSSDSTGSVVGQEHRQGYVWRGKLKVEELDEDLAERVTKAVTDLGGGKAGNVTLGWHRGQNYYYHFILPEENYDKLLNALNAEGIVQLTKERHPRIIKSGYIRVIMSVEQDENEAR